MARKRALSPMIWEDPSFNALTREARLLFIGMISHADDEGYIRADAGSLRRAIFGFDEETKGLEKWLLELGSIRSLHFYEVGGERYAHFAKWHVHQKQQKERIQPSTYPVCSICSAGVEHLPTQVSKEVKKDKVSKVKLSKKVPTSDEPTSYAPTPKDKARDFFEGVIKLQNKVEVPWLQEFLKVVSENSKVGKEAIWKEVKAFTSYWTELNPTGTKQRWHMQKTFEVERRLKTWFDRAGHKGFSVAGASRSKGKSIIGLNDEDNG